MTQLNSTKIYILVSICFLCSIKSSVAFEMSDLETKILAKMVFGKDDLDCKLIRGVGLGHNGIDLQCKNSSGHENLPVFSPVEGTLEKVISGNGKTKCFKDQEEFLKEPDYQNYNPEISIKDSEGRIWTFFHLKINIALLKAGGSVLKNNQLGEQSNLGWVCPIAGSGFHVHIEVKDAGGFWDNQDFIDWLGEAKARKWEVLESSYSDRNSQPAIKNPLYLEVSKLTPVPNRINNSFTTSEESNSIVFKITCPDCNWLFKQAGENNWVSIKNNLHFELKAHAGSDGYFGTAIFIKLRGENNFYTTLVKLKKSNLNRRASSESTKSFSAKFEVEEASSLGANTILMPPVLSESLSSMSGSKKDLAEYPPSWLLTCDGHPISFIRTDADIHFIDCNNNTITAWVDILPQETNTNDNPIDLVRKISLGRYYFNGRKIVLGDRISETNCIISGDTNLMRQFGSNYCIYDQNNKINARIKLGDLSTPHFDVPPEDYGLYKFPSWGQSACFVYIFDEDDPNSVSDDHQGCVNKYGGRFPDPTWPLYSLPNFSKIDPEFLKRIFMIEYSESGTNLTPNLEFKGVFGDINPATLSYKLTKISKRRTVNDPWEEFELATDLLAENIGCKTFETPNEKLQFKFLNCRKSELLSVEPIGDLSNYQIVFFIRPCFLTSAKNERKCLLEYPLPVGFNDNGTDLKPFSAGENFTPSGDPSYYYKAAGENVFLNLKGDIVLVRESCFYPENGGRICSENNEPNFAELKIGETVIDHKAVEIITPFYRYGASFENTVSENDYISTRQGTIVYKKNSINIYSQSLAIFPPVRPVLLDNNLDRWWNGESPLQLISFKYLNGEPAVLKSFNKRVEPKIARMECTFGFKATPINLRTTNQGIFVDGIAFDKQCNSLLIESIAVDSSMQILAAHFNGIHINLDNEIPSIKKPEQLYAIKTGGKYEITLPQTDDGLNGSGPAQSKIYVLGKNHEPLLSFSFSASLPSALSFALPIEYISEELHINIEAFDNVGNKAVEEIIYKVTPNDYIPSDLDSVEVAQNSSSSVELTTSEPLPIEPQITILTAPWHLPLKIKWGGQSNDPASNIESYSISLITEEGVLVSQSQVVGTEFQFAGLKKFRGEVLKLIVQSKNAGLFFEPVVQNIFISLEEGPNCDLDSSGSDKPDIGDLAKILGEVEVNEASSENACKEFACDFDRDGNPSVTSGDFVALQTMILTDEFFGLCP